MAAMATSGASDLLRGWPCWSTTVSRTVRSSASRIRTATSCAAAACPGVYAPCRAMNPAWPTPVAAAEPLWNGSGEGLPIWLASDRARVRRCGAGRAGQVLCFALRLLMTSSMAALKLFGSTSASERNVSVRCTPLI